MSEIIKIKNVVKEYRLGAIGGGTLKNDLQTFFARLRKKEDPNSQIGSQPIANAGGRFRALDGVSFIVNQGEAVGIIGHNGAGKSTLLKLLSRVTAPTSGTISFNGRIASMLEVGTGFHAELTGRENIFLNGAILGMTKKEISSKINDIIHFAEMERFIDTPVKRYSSGMYVKLAFAVAAHLDSEIMVMDEVLAVGDMKFQQKCLGKMGDAAANDGKTVLYVSHNMNTIRQLCTRCIVLKRGKVIFDGDTEEAIAVYTEAGTDEKYREKDLRGVSRYYLVEAGRNASFTYMEFIGVKNNTFSSKDIMKVRLTWKAEVPIENTSVRFVIWSINGNPVASAISMDFCTSSPDHDNIYDFEIPLNQLMEGLYEVQLVLFQRNEFGTSTEIDVIRQGFSFEITTNDKLIWSPQWGHICLPEMRVTKANVQ